jgi:hypothetical protein
MYKESEIGDYVLGFVAQDSLGLGREYQIPARLEVSDFPVPGHTQQDPRRK